MGPLSTPCLPRCQVIPSWLALLFLMLPLSLPASPRVAVVDFDVLSRMMADQDPEFSRRSQLLEDQIAATQNGIEELKKTIGTFNSQAIRMSREGNQARAEEIFSQAQAFEETRSGQERTLARLQADLGALTVELEQKISAAIAEIAKAKNVDLVLQSPERGAPLFLHQTAPLHFILLNRDVARTLGLDPDQP